MNSSKAGVVKGFTIIELIIVITVIGILSTIILVSYGGVQNQSKTQNAKAVASSIQRKIESYASLANSFPDAKTAAQYTAQLNMYGDSSIRNSAIVIGAPGPDNGTTTIQITQCNSAPGLGYQIRYWDFSSKSLSADVLTGSLGASPCSAWTAPLR